ncbi:MAG: DDE-type integrase/transposase/recombinase [Proteobacteria bacterium]|nr:DDE-type integrase/transposase/recombinase [Pseudomonadota bacterium]
MKQKLVTAPVLSYPDFSLPYLVHTDASGYALGAALSQQKPEEKREHPIAYSSRTLTKAEKNYPIIEKEALAVIYAVKTFRPYLYGHPFTVVTDHEPLKWLLTTANPSSRITRWSLLLRQFDQCVIEYRPGRNHGNVDALSRVMSGPEPTEDLDPLRDLPLYVLPRTPWEIDPDLNLGKEQREDPFFGPMITYLEEDILPTDYEKAKVISTESPKYQLIANCLYYYTNDRRNQLRLVLAIPEKLRYPVFEFLHSVPTAGHLGTQKTTDKIAERYYWPSFREDILTWVQQCDPCAMKKNPPKTVRAPLVPVRPLGRFQRWALDIHGPMPTTEAGYKYLAVFMEYSTRYPEVFPVRDITAQTMADLFIRKIVCRYGVPLELLTDQGAQLISEMVKYVCAKLGTVKLQTSAYHPSSDGMVERFMSTLVNMLAQYVSTTQKDWDKIIDYVLFAYRTSVQSSLKESSHYLVYGTDAMLPIDSALGLPNPTYVDQPETKVEFIQRMNQAWQLAAQNLEKSQQKQKQNYDQKNTASPISVPRSGLDLHPQREKGQKSETSPLVARTIQNLRNFWSNCQSTPSQQSQRDS